MASTVIFERRARTLENEFFRRMDQELMRQLRGREEVLSAAEARGVEKGALCYQVLEDWLRNRPDDQLFAAWRDYIAEVRKALGGEELQQLRDDVIRRARDVARETGGVLGLGTVSEAEEAILTDVARAFDGQTDSA